MFKTIVSFSGQCIVCEGFCTWFILRLGGVVVAIDAVTGEDNARSTVKLG